MIGAVIVAITDLEVAVLGAEGHNCDECVCIYVCVFPTRRGALIGS